MSLENELTSKNIENLFAKSGMSTNSNLISIRERREKALNFANSIKKPKIKTDPTAEDFGEERFVEFDNKQYMLENQKIKMLFG